jgi:hypothetical protein
VVALDVTFFNASASDASVVTKTRLEKDRKQIEWDIDAYCQGLDAQNQQESGSAPELGTTCELDAKLAKLKARQIWRSEHAEVAEAHRERMATQRRERMVQRASVVEHPLGTLKRWFGWNHFLVRGEMALMVLGYNLIRVINILGLQAFRDYCAQRLTGGPMAAQVVVAA